MPQPKVPDYWRDRVKGLLAEHDGRISDRKMYQVLKEESRELRKSSNNKMRALADSYPSTRTIGRIRSDEYVPMAEEEKAKYRLFHWPQSLERGDLPETAGAAGLELLAYAHTLGAGRPFNRVVEAFWRVSQAAPKEPIHGRLAIALDIVSYRLQGREIPAGLEWWLAYAVAHSKGSVANGSHEAAVLDPDNPIPDYSSVIGFPPVNEQGTDDLALMGDYDFALATMFGSIGIRLTSDPV
jgi:hypothetical protein